MSIHLFSFVVPLNQFFHVAALLLVCIDPFLVSSLLLFLFSFQSIDLLLYLLSLRTACSHLGELVLEILYGVTPLLDQE